MPGNEAIIDPSLLDAVASRGPEELTPVFDRALTQRARHLVCLGVSSAGDDANLVEDVIAEATAVLELAIEIATPPEETSGWSDFMGKVVAREKELLVDEDRRLVYELVTDELRQLREDPDQ